MSVKDTISKWEYFGIFRIMTIAPNQKRYPQLVLLVLIVFFVISFITNILNSIIVAVKDSFELSLSGAGFLPFSFFIAYAVMSIPAGFLTERYSSKSLLTASFVVIVVSCIVLVLNPSYNYFLGTLFVLGLSMAVLQVIINPMLRLAGGEEHFAFNSVMAQVVFGGASFLSPWLYLELIKDQSLTWINNILPNWIPQELPWLSLYLFFALLALLILGGAYLPIMSDEAMIVDKTGSIFLAGSYLVKAAIGESIDNETLGGATTHCAISGVTDYKYDNDQQALDAIRNIIDKIGAPESAGFNRATPALPQVESDQLFGLLPKSRADQYDMMAIIKALVDNSEFDAYKAAYGKTIITGYARINGWAVGIVANQRKVVKTQKGEMQFGGVIYSDSADKATRFIANCNQKKIPLVFLQDVTGFMVGSKSEHGGIIKDGAKMVNAVSNSVVPKFTIILGNSYGAGNYAMCGKAYDPRLIVAWPSAELAVMSGNSAAKVLLQIETAQKKKTGTKLSPEEEQKLYEQIKARYDEQISPYYAASRLWTDAVINPVETRKWISMGIEAADHAPITQPFNLGVIQV